MSFSHKQTNKRTNEREKHATEPFKVLTILYILMKQSPSIIQTISLEHSNRKWDRYQKMGTHKNETMESIVLYCVRYGNLNWNLFNVSKEPNRPLWWCLQSDRETDTQSKMRHGCDRTSMYTYRKWKFVCE